MSKLKGSSNAIRMKHIVLLFIVSVLVALPLRTYQLLIMVNPENGFFENANFAVPVLYIAAFVFTALFIVLSFFSKGIPAPKMKDGKNIVLGTASIALSVAFVWDVINVVQTLTPQVLYGYNSYASQTLIATFIKENGGIFVVLQLVFAALSALYFLIFGVSYFEGKATYKKIPLMALSPVIWGMSILITKLMKPVSFVTVSELLFEIFAFVFIMIFFLTFARVSTGVFTENGMWSVFGCGFAAILFGGIITVPRLVVYFVGRPPVQGHEFNLTHLFVVVFIGVALFSLLGAGFKDGFKGFSGFTDLGFDDEENIIIKSGNNVVEEDIVEEAVTQNSVEAVSDDEINRAMEKFLDKGSVADFLGDAPAKADDESDGETIEEEPEEVVEEIIEEEPEEVVEEIIEEEPEEVVEEVIEEEPEEVVEEVIEEEPEEVVEEIIEEEPEEVAEEIIEKESQEIVENNAEDSFLALEDMVMGEEDEEDEASESGTEQEEQKVEIVDNEVSEPQENQQESSVEVDKKPVKAKKEKNTKEKQEKIKKEKAQKKKLFGKNKKQDASADDTEIKLVSLADLRKKSDME